MTPTQSSIGQLLTEPHQRDAIHIAVAPVVACERLSPGQHIGLDANGCARWSRTTTGPIGLVDPYLTAPVEPGQRFWLFLYPNTIESIRHDWVHPAFGLSGASKSDAEARIAAFAGKMDMGVRTLMTAAKDWVEMGVTTGMGANETFNDTTEAEWVQFWADYEAVTGTPVPVTQRQAGIFSCAC